MAVVREGGFRAARHSHGTIDVFGHAGVRADPLADAQLSARVVPLKRDPAALVLFIIVTVAFVVVKRKDAVRAGRGLFMAGRTRRYGGSRGGRRGPCWEKTRACTRR